MQKKTTLASAIGRFTDGLLACLGPGLKQHAWQSRVTRALFFTLALFALLIRQALLFLRTKDAPSTPEDNSTHSHPVAKSDVPSLLTFSRALRRLYGRHRSDAVPSLLTENEPASNPPLPIRESLFAPKKSRILVLKLDHLGDFLLAFPALSKLHARFPAADIDLLVGPWNEQLAKRLPFVSQVFTYTCLERSRRSKATAEDPELLSVLSHLPDYDYAIDLRTQPETRFILPLISARTKAGFTSFDTHLDNQINIVLPRDMESGYAKAPSNKEHQSLQMVRLVDALPASPSDYIDLPRIASSRKVPGSVAVFPTAGVNTRQWLEPNFSELVCQLCQRQEIQHVTVYLAGSSEENAYNFPPHPKLTFAAGLSLSDLIDSVSMQEICIANNSGGAHLASYCGATVVALFSGTETPEEWRPPFGPILLHTRDLPCSPCHLSEREHCPNNFECMADISVNDVLNSVLNAIKRAKSTHAGSLS